MLPSQVKPGLKVWVHKHHSEPIAGVLVDDQVSNRSIYDWINVRYTVDGVTLNWSTELSAVTVDGDVWDLAYYWHNGVKCYYRYQAVDRHLRNPQCIEQAHQTRVTTTWYGSHVLKLWVSAHRFISRFVLRAKSMLTFRG